MLLKKQKKKTQLEFSSIENAKISYCWSFILLDMLGLKYGWGFKLLEMLKYSAIAVLYCSKRKYKVRLGFSFIEKFEVMHF